MSIHTATATWDGTLKDGKGVIEGGSKVFKQDYTFATRFENATGTNPDELAGAALAGCYSMFLSALLSGEKYTDIHVESTAKVTVEKDDIGPKITEIKLTCEARVPGITADAFQELAKTAKKNCPISRLFAGTSITLDARLV